METIKELKKRYIYGRSLHTGGVTDSTELVKSQVACRDCPMVLVNQPLWKQ